MGALEEGGKVASGTVEALKTQPLALALIVINVIFLVGGGWVLHDIAQRTNEGNIRRDKMIMDVINRDCRPKE